MLQEAAAGLTRAEREGGDAWQKVPEAHVVALPGRSMAQQPVAPPHRLRRLQPAGNTSAHDHHPTHCIRLNAPGP